MNKKAGVVYSLPMTIWLTFLFVLPSLGVIAISFLKKGLYGGAELKFSFEGYTSLINPSFFKVLINTIEISVLSTLITVLIAIPVALYIATSNKKTLLLLLIIIPFWTNFLIRVYAWIAILGNNGFLNNFLIFLRDTIPFLNKILQNAPYRFMYNKNAIIL
ncbi:MAG: spermidine/putrescine transport system permease protein, partial [Fusobacteriaceae bacterium]|nr:spermidine/putrescine transport system permease protein [Fusobacteriaceae bacterium]